MLLSVCSQLEWDNLFVDLWEPYIRGTFSTVGYKYQYWSCVIFPSFPSVVNTLISALYFLVGSFFSFSYVDLLLSSLVISLDILPSP